MRLVRGYRRRHREPQPLDILMLRHSQEPITPASADWSKLWAPRFGCLKLSRVTCYYLSNHKWLVGRYHDGDGDDEEVGVMRVCTGKTKGINCSSKYL